MTRISEELRKIAAATSKTDSPNSSSTEPRPRLLPGDADCPICGGVGYLREDLPIGHPDFGKVTICSCRAAEVSLALRERLFKVSNLEALRHLTFESFQPFGRMGRPDGYAVTISQAYNTARAFASDLQGWLVLQGGFGCGKTHLAAAVANFAVSMGVSTLFITVPDLLDWMRFSYGSEEVTFEERFEEIRSTTLLVLDDFGTENATAWAQEKLFQVLNYRYINRLPVVITTNRAMDQIEGRIQSRMRDKELARICYINAPDYRDPSSETTVQEYSILGLLSRCTFEKFDLRRTEGLPADDLRELEAAYRAARAFADQPSGWLVFRGSYSTGKTHLAAAIGNFRHNAGHEVLMVSVPELLDLLRSSFSPTSPVTYDQRFELYKTTPLLILDDLGMHSATPWAREKLYQLFNYRYNAELPTVITLSESSSDIDQRLITRILDKRISKGYSLNVPPYAAGQAFSRTAHPSRRPAK